MKTPQQLSERRRVGRAGRGDGELGAYGLNALTRRLGVVGVSLG